VQSTLFKYSTVVGKNIQDGKKQANNNSKKLNVF